MLQYHWVEWNTYENRTRRFALLEKEIIFDKNKKNSVVSLQQLKKEDLQKYQDYFKRSTKNGVYRISNSFVLNLKILDSKDNMSKIFEIIGRNGELVSFGHALFEINFSIKLPK